MIKFGRIGVLMGGLSSEREVSLKSGKAVACALKKSGIDVVSIDINPVEIASPSARNDKREVIARSGATWQSDSERSEPNLVYRNFKREILRLAPQNDKKECHSDPECNEGKESNLIKDYVIGKIKNARVDIVFIALHGKFGEDGTIQSLLEENGIPYTGSGVSASRLAMDKVRSRELFQKEGLSVPRCIVLNSHSQKRGKHVCLESASFVRAGMVSEGRASAKTECSLTRRGKQTSDESLPISFPLIVKPSSQGSSIGLSLVETEDKLNKAIDLAYKYDDTVLLEEYISGKEVTVAILNDKPLPVVHIVPGNRFYDYNAKYKSNSTQYICPANLGRREYKRVQESGLIAHKCLGCKSFSRVDMILREDGIPVVLEVNTIPGLTSKSLLPKAAKAAGISFEKLCIKILLGNSKC